jgi:hypothetical protein
MVAFPEHKLAGNLKFKKNCYIYLRKRKLSGNKDPENNGCCKVKIIPSFSIECPMEEKEKEQSFP